MLSKDKIISLKTYNTFGIDVSAREVILLKDINQWHDINNRTDCLILGGGSNVLLTEDLDKTVVINQITGINEIELEGDEILIEACSGVNWHDLVMYTVAKNYGGLENLSLIPGSVGAAPMQNIGAYGVEIKDVIDEVEAVSLNELSTKIFSKEECEFGYRESIFKKAAKGKYFIYKVRLRLRKNNHQLNTSYGAIQDVLAEKGISTPSIKDVSEAVIEIRKSKLPDPKDLGNSGSFFKNPVIPKSHFDVLSKQFPDIKSFPVDSDHIKVPAAWLIESLGWKGKRVGETGSHAKQALVLVNYGKATGSEIKDLSEAIKRSVKDKYQIELETEVNIIP